MNDSLADENQKQRKVKVQNINESATTLLGTQAMTATTNVNLAIILEDQPNESREPSQRLPGELIDFKKVKGMGMFAELNNDNSKRLNGSNLLLNEDYSQNLGWASALKNVPCLRRTLRCFGQSTQIHLNGLYHRGRKEYILESVGLISLVFWLIIIITDIRLLAPAFKGEVFRVATD